MEPVRGSAAALPVPGWASLRRDGCDTLPGVLAVSALAEGHLPLHLSWSGSAAAAAAATDGDDEIA